MECGLIRWAQVLIADRASREINIFLKNPPQGRKVPPHGQIGEGVSYRKGVLRIILLGFKGGSTTLGIPSKVG
jgi:hypothetical protein